MSETEGSRGSSAAALRDRTGRVGGFAGALGALLMIAGLITMGALPGNDATAPQVYEFFLAEDGEVARPTALIAIGGVPGSPYDAPDFTEEGAPDPIGKKYDEMGEQEFSHKPFT